MHEQNRGVGAAIVTGYKRAIAERMDVTAVMAGDNQMDPDELEGLCLSDRSGRARLREGEPALQRQRVEADSPQPLHRQRRS